MLKISEGRNVGKHSFNIFFVKQKNNSVIKQSLL